MPAYRLAFLVFAVIASPAVAAEFTPPATCDADLAALDASFAETLARLEKVTPADKVELCAAVKHHIEVMEHAAAVFQQCLPECHDKGENMGQALATAYDFRDISAEKQCPPLPDPQPLPGAE